mmetsp:Transcript_1229/g.3964  ORF Transcript_1229/g.3964 Transcript_1229/m.3964 type:complete len:1016 (-) Transcript_1229:10-3057(-)
MVSMAPLLQPGTLLAGRFEVSHEIGSGANSHVYRARDQRHNDRPVAVKIERVMPANRQLLQTEAEVLHALRGCLGIPQMVAFVEGDKAAGGSLLAMELLGEDVRKVGVQAQRFSAGAVAFLGIQMLAALQGVHERGLVHRDVKPGNFAFGRRPAESLKVYLIDFGLVRRHLEDNGAPRRARSKTPFRGTTHYASMAAMLGKDLGRVDDLWSLAFSLLELSVGSLPWDKLYRKGLPREQKERAKRRVLEEKKRLVAAVAHSDPQAIEALRPSARFLRHVPRQLQDFIRELLPLRYDSRPEYSRLRDLLLDVGPDEECRHAAEREIHAARARAAARQAQEAAEGQGAQVAPQKGRKPGAAGCLPPEPRAGDHSRSTENSEEPLSATGPPDGQGQVSRPLTVPAERPAARPVAQEAEALDEVPVVEDPACHDEEVEDPPPAHARASEPMSEAAEDLRAGGVGALNSAGSAQPPGGNDCVQGRGMEDPQAGAPAEHSESEASAVESGGMSAQDTKDEGEACDEDALEAASGAAPVSQQGVPGGAEAHMEQPQRAVPAEVVPGAAGGGEPCLEGPMETGEEVNVQMQEAAAPEEGPTAGEGSAELQADVSLEDAPDSSARGSPRGDPPEDEDRGGQPPAEARGTQSSQQGAAEASQVPVGAPGASEADAELQPAAISEEDRPVSEWSTAESPQPGAPEGEEEMQDAPAGVEADVEPQPADALEEDLRANEAGGEASVQLQPTAGPEEDMPPAAEEASAERQPPATSQEDMSPAGGGANEVPLPAAAPEEDMQGVPAGGEAGVEPRPAAAREELRRGAPAGARADVERQRGGTAPQVQELPHPAAASAPPRQAREQPHPAAASAPPREVPPVVTSRVPSVQARVLRIVRRTEAPPRPAVPELAVAPHLEVQAPARGVPAAGPRTASSGYVDRGPVGPRKRKGPPPRAGPCPDIVGFVCRGDREGQPPRLLRARLMFADVEPPTPLQPPWQRVGVGGGVSALLAFVGPQPPAVRTGVGPGAG